MNVSTMTLTAIDVMSKIGSFYNYAWNTLIAVVTISFAITGIVIPLLYAWYRRSSDSARTKEILDRLQDESMRIQEKVVAESKKIISKDLDERDRKVFKAIKVAESRVFHVQGNMMLRDKNYIGAFESFLAAAQHQTSFGDNFNLRRIIPILIGKVFPNLIRTDITPEINLKFDKWIASLKEKDSELDCVFSDDISKLKIQFEKARERTVVN
jgi:hypothetical protein